MIVLCLIVAHDLKRDTTPDFKVLLIISVQGFSLFLGIFSEITGY